MFLNALYAIILIDVLSHFIFMFPQMKIKLSNNVFSKYIIIIKNIKPRVFFEHRAPRARCIKLYNYITIRVNLPVNV
jgi:hypothetical protein